MFKKRKNITEMISSGAEVFYKDRGIMACSGFSASRQLEAPDQATRRQQPLQEWQMRLGQSQERAPPSCTKAYSREQESPG